VVAVNDDDGAAERRGYARLLDLGTRAGFVVLIATFLVYATGALPAAVPLAELPRYWGLPVAEYVAATGAPTGWAWLARLREADALNFVGVALLALVTIACYAAVLPLFLRRGERALAAIAALEIVVLVIAAGGWVIVGH
jgi:hypothetical protein